MSAYEYEEARLMDTQKAIEVYQATLARFEENMAELFLMKHSPEAADEDRKVSLVTIIYVFIHLCNQSSKQL